MAWVGVTAIGTALLAQFAMQERVAKIVREHKQCRCVLVRVAHRLEDPHVEGDRNWSGSRFWSEFQRLRLRTVVWDAVGWENGYEGCEQFLERIDHGLLAGHDDSDRGGLEEFGSDLIQPRRQIFQLGLVQTSKTSHRVEHANPLEAIVQGALRTQLGVRAKNRELEAEAGQRALQASRHLGDDFLQSLRLDLEASDEISQKLDEWLRVAVQGSTRHHERFDVVVTCGE